MYWTQGGQLNAFNLDHSHCNIAVNMFFINYTTYKTNIFPILFQSYTRKYPCDSTFPLRVIFNHPRLPETATSVPL